MQKFYRLSARSDFRSLFRTGKRHEFALFRVVHAANAVRHLRTAVVIPKAAEKKATVRNRTRRRIQEWIRKRPALLHQSRDVVFLLKKEGVQSSRKELYEKLNAACANVFR